MENKVKSLIKKLEGIKEQKENIIEELSEYINIGFGLDVENYFIDGNKITIIGEYLNYGGSFSITIDITKYDFKTRLYENNQHKFK